MTLPVLVHIHIPKCAGQWMEQVIFEICSRLAQHEIEPDTWLRRLRWRVYRRVGGPQPEAVPREHRFMQLEHKRYFGDIDAFERMLLERPWIRGLSSQKFRHTFPPELAGRPVHYVALLRDPEQQVLSFIRFARALYATAHPDFRGMLPPGLEEMDAVTATEMVLRPKYVDVVRRILPSSFFSRSLDESEAFAQLDAVRFLGTTGGSDALARRVVSWARPGEAYELFIPASRINRSEVNEEEDRLVRASPAFRAFLESREAQLSRRLFERAAERELEAAERENHLAGVC